MTRRSVAIAGTLLAAAAAHAPSALAAPGTVLAVSAVEPAITDGEQATAISFGTNRIRIVHRAASRDITLQEPCYRQSTAIGGGYALWNCLQGPRTIDVATGAVEPRPALAGWTPPAAFTATTWNGIGSAAASIPLWDSNGRPVPLATVDWRTGATLPAPSVDEEIVDLDSAGGRTRMCAPLKVFTSGWNGRRERLAYAYDAPYGVGMTPTLDTLAVQRCGKGTVATVPVRDQSPFQLAGGMLTAESERGQFVYAIDCQLRLDWDVPTAQRSVALLDGALIVSTPDDNYGWIVRRVPLGKPCERAATAGSVRVTARGRTVRGAVRALAFADAPTAAAARRTDDLSEPAPRLAVAPGRALSVTTGRVASELRWRLGGGAWRFASGSDRSWRLTLPRLRGEQRLTIAYADGERLSGSAAVRVRQTRG